MNIDVDRFLAPVSVEDVAGPDLAYDPERFAIEQAFETRTDGYEETPLPPPDWPATIALIEAQAGRTKDLWLAVYLCRAAAHAGTLGLVATGTELLATMLETMWQDMHPLLDEYGFQGRKAACDTLASFRGFVDPLAGITLLDHPRLGAFTTGDLVRFAHGGPDEEGYGRFRTLLESDEALVGGLACTLAQIDAARAALKRADVALVGHAGGETATNFAPVYEQLGAIHAAIRAALPPELRDEDEDADATGAAGGRLPPALSGRDEVIDALNLVIDYYRRREPSSPIPLLLERAKGWVPLDFVGILDDIAPRAIDDVRMVLQARTSR